ncbi:uncharacterized protein PFLUO_LOCUS6710 [Penicillium psychrofluorescens]|uniref:uncharacterized protein n=1 Tax=Penicillium psychrofluorescens TaxID=3158075 RepID=UPI003CCDB1D2
MELLIFLTAVLFFTIFSAAASLPKTWSLSSLLPNDTGPATISQVPIGAVIDHCIVPGTVALTFDDGPYIYTPQILDTLSQRGARATFFLNGVHMGNIHEYTDVMRRTIAEGHQLASHTWSHPYLSTLDHAGIVSQMTQLEDAFASIVGIIPRYMRMPFLMFNPLALSVMAELGYHVIGASIDTKDYEHDDAGQIWLSFEKFKAELNAGGTIVLAHDVHYNTVNVLVENMLNEIEARGLIRKLHPLPLPGFGF